MYFQIGQKIAEIHEPYSVNLSSISILKVQRQDIIVQLPCPTPNGTAALHYYGLLPHDALPFHFRHLGATWNATLCWLIPACITIIAFIFIGRICSKKSQKLIWTLSRIYFNKSVTASAATSSTAYSGYRLRRLNWRTI